MRKNYIIRNVLATLMLAVLAFSVTPKILLHNLVADHKDTPIKSNCSNQEQFSKAGFNCNCDNLVVESPFVNDFIPVDLSIAKQFVQQQTFFKNNFHSLHYFYFELRGPPVNFAD
jgi:hypothetical protein